jgi:hemin uptake protein HemP
MTTTPDKDERDRAGLASNVPARRSVDVIDRCIDSRDLFVSTREIVIKHAGETYRLRLTAQNKLILTK